MVMSFYKIKNPDTKVEVEITERTYIDILNSVKHRKKELYEILKEKFERLEQRNFSDEQIKKLGR